MKIVPQQTYDRLIDVTQQLIDLEREYLAEAIEVAARSPDPDAALAEFNKGRAGRTKRLYNLKEMRHVLTLGKTYPGRNFFGQTSILRLEAADGRVLKVFGRGELRIADFSEISGEFAELGDIKSKYTTVASVQGRRAKVNFDAIFRRLSAIGKGHAREARMFAAARKLKGFFVLRVHDVVRDHTFEVRIHHTKLRRKSIVVDYQEVHSSKLPPPKGPNTPLGAGPPKGGTSPSAGGAGVKASAKMPAKTTMRAPPRATALPNRATTGKGVRARASSVATKVSRMTRGVTTASPRITRLGGGLRRGAAGGVRMANSAMIWGMGEKLVNAYFTGDPDVSLGEYVVHQQFQRLEQAQTLKLFEMALDKRLEALNGTALQIYSSGGAEVGAEIESTMGFIDAALQRLAEGDASYALSDLAQLRKHLKLTRDVVVIGARNDPVRATGPEDPSDDLLLFNRFIDQVRHLERVIKQWRPHIE